MELTTEVLNRLEDLFKNFLAKGTYVEIKYDDDGMYFIDKKRILSITVSTEEKKMSFSYGGSYYKIEFSRIDKIESDLENNIFIHAQRAKNSMQ
ncbi:MAG: hypothetical protein K6F69_08585 [Treponema sp.]|nr:hypothetical protein [Treponema sp.]